MTESEVKQLIENDLNNAQVWVKDTTGTGDHFSAVVVCPEFEGTTRIQQHRLVYAACGSYLTHELHALQLQTYTPAEWQAEKQRNHENDK